MKFLEYCWLHGIYSLQDFPASMWRDLQEKFNSGGWGAALDVTNRAMRVLEALPEHGFGDLWLVGKRKNITISTRFSEALGTNLNENELGKLRALLAKRAGVQVAHSETPMTFSAIAQFNTQIGSLADLPSGHGLTSVPTENPYLYAKANGAPQGRTRSVTPEMAATLLVESFKWVHDYGPAIVAMLHAIKAGLPVQAAQGTSQSEHSRRCRRFLRESTEVTEVGRLIGAEVGFVDKGGWNACTSIAVVVKTLLTACFNLIAAMNGRRKDELIGRSIGLHADSFRVVSSELGLFECSFYIEKTVHDYEWFHVNEITSDALDILKQVSSLAWDAHDAITGKQTAAKDRMLFVLPAFSSRNAGGRIFFQYQPTYVSYVAPSMDGEALVVHAHVFRRLYAVIFNYRYENASLLALSRQLRHRDIAMTAHYVLEPGSREMVQRAELNWPISREAMLSNQVSHAGELLKEIEAVAEEKLREVVEKIVHDADQFSGGFPKLVSRLYRKLDRRMSYANMSKKEKAKTLADLLMERGHRLVPFAHGDCNASVPKPSANCFSKVHETLDRSRASAATCASCPYHRVSRAHFHALEDEANEMRRELDMCARPISVRRTNLERELTVLDRALALHRARLEAGRI